MLNLSIFFISLWGLPFSRADFQEALPKQATNLIQNFPNQNDPRYFLPFSMMITSLSNKHILGTFSSDKDIFETIWKSCVLHNAYHYVCNQAPPNLWTIILSISVGCEPKAGMPMAASFDLPHLACVFTARNEQVSPNFLQGKCGHFQVVSMTEILSFRFPYSFPSWEQCVVVSMQFPEGKFTFHISLEISQCWILGFHLLEMWSFRQWSSSVKTAYFMAIYIFTYNETSLLIVKLFAV